MKGTQTITIIWSFCWNLITLPLMMKQLSSMKHELTAALCLFSIRHSPILVTSHPDLGPAPPRCPHPWWWLRCTCGRSDQDGKVPERYNKASSPTLLGWCPLLYVARLRFSQSRLSPLLGSLGSRSCWWPRSWSTWRYLLQAGGFRPLTAGAYPAHFCTVNFPTLWAELSL